MRFSSDRPIVPNNVPSYAPAPIAAPAPAGPPAGGAPAGRGAGGAGGGAGAAGGGRGAGGGAGGAGGGGGGGGRGGGAPAGPQQESMPSCESGYTYPEPNNHRFVWGTCYAAHVATYDEMSGQTRSVSPWLHTLDSDPVNLKYRCHWSPPLAIDWFDNSVYFGCQVIFRTRDRGQNWEVISDDLSTKDPSRIRFSGGVVGDNLGQFYGAVVSAIAPSRLQKGVVWAGTNDGKVWIMREDKKWIDLTKNVPMPPWGLVRRIDASSFDPGTAYMAVDYHLVDNRDPYLFKTSDFGATWTRIDATLPKGHPLDYALSIAENPNRKGMVFAGTGHGFFYSKDDGKTWTQFKDKLPAAPVNWIEVPKNAPEVAVATYGRGVWILRDVWTLEQNDQLEQAAELKLYKPRPGIRRNSGGNADFVFSLATAPAATNPITMEILDDKGAVLSTSQVQGRAGMNKVSWNLLTASPTQPVLAIDAARQSQHLGRGALAGARAPGHALGHRVAALAAARAPGKYTVRMTYNGKAYTQPSRSGATSRCRPRMWISRPARASSATSSARSTTWWTRSTASRSCARRSRTCGRRTPPTRPSTRRSRTSTRKCMTAELHYLSKTEMHSDDKWYVEKYKLYLNLVWLLGEVGGGASDVAGGVAYGPTSASLNVYEDQLKLLEAAKSAFAKLMADVEAFNKANAGKLPAISDKLPGR
jgi:hypothetical protein